MNKYLHVRPFGPLSFSYFGPPSPGCKTSEREGVEIPAPFSQSFGGSKEVDVCCIQRPDNVGRDKSMSYAGQVALDTVLKNFVSVTLGIENFIRP
jgi:hypothetical protein